MAQVNMMQLKSNWVYQNDVRQIAMLPLPWDRLSERTFVISGATGMIGSFLIDVLMYRNQHMHQNCEIYALGRSPEKAQRRFNEYWDNDNFHYTRCDITQSLHIAGIEQADYCFHAASNTHPRAYAEDPIGTVLANVYGLKNFLDFAHSHSCKAFLFASSNEIYGENRGDTDSFSEEYCGYIDCNTLRAGYPESKRVGESLCQAYIHQKGMNIIIPRFTRSFGPTMLMNDSKAISQFIKNALTGDDIVLKSNGKQYYSFTYVADAVSGMLTCLFFGKNGEAYNISNHQCDTTLLDLANLIAQLASTKVVFETTTDKTEQSGYSVVTRAILNSSKLQQLGWVPKFNLETSLQHTLTILRHVQ